jgi:hypothetical protein
MKAARVVLTILPFVLLVAALLTVSAYAEKPPSPPGRSRTETVSITGAISGTGVPASIAIALGPDFQGTDVYGGSRDESGSFIANPDYPPALKMFGVPKDQTLSYYYCDYVGPDHVITPDGICADTRHDPEHYKRLQILGGTVEKETRDIVFPIGSAWQIGWKVTGVALITGTISEQVRYHVDK